MTTFKRIILFYILGLILILFSSLILGRDFISVFKTLGFWTLPAIFSIIGFLIGAGVYELMLRPAKKRTKVFLITHCIGVIILASLIVVQHINWRNKERNKISDNNHHIMKYFVENNEEYIRLAFNRLESEFKNPNDFKLDAFSVHKQDTTLNSIQDTAYNIYFTYFLNSDKQKMFFSKILVLKKKPTLLLYNIDTKTNKEYINNRAQWKKTEEETFRSIKESFQQMSDSTRKVIIDTIKKAIRN